MQPTKNKVTSCTQIEPKYNAEPFIQDSLVVVGGPSTKQTQVDLATANVAQVDMHFNMQHLASSTAVVMLL